MMPACRHRVVRIPAGIPDEHQVGPSPALIAPNLSSRPSAYALLTVDMRHRAALGNTTAASSATHFPQFTSLRMLKDPLAAQPVARRFRYAHPHPTPAEIPVVVRLPTTLGLAGGVWWKRS